jgi:hypothetical protein
MAKVLETVIAVKISKIVKDNDENDGAIAEDQLIALIESIPQLAESVINDPAVVVEIMELE